MPAPNLSMPAPNRIIGLILVCLGALMGPLDTAVNVAFPAITSAFGLPLRQIQWVVVPFALAQSAVTLLSGRLGDLMGHRRIFAIGMACCVVTHVAAGFAPSFAWLIGLRVLQGVAVGLAMACAPALATLMFEPRLKRRVVSVYVTSFSFGLAIGPLLGGLLIAWLGWPGVFWFRAPLALLVLVLIALVADARATDDADAGPRDTGTGLPLPTMRTRGFLACQLDSVVINCAVFAILLLVPYALTGWPGQSIAASGALIALFPGGSLLGGLLAGRAGGALSSVALTRAGLLVAALGLLLTAVLIESHSPVALGLALLATGIGLGSFQVGYMDLTTTMLPPRSRGIAGAMVTVTRLTGILVGVTGIGALHEVLDSHRSATALMGAGLLAYAMTAMMRRGRPAAGAGAGAGAGAATAPAPSADADADPR